jgi:hypothetical protein
MIQLMQALFSTMPETAQQPMTDFRRSCLEAEEKNELDAAPDDMDGGQQPGDPYADEIKRLEAEYGPFANGMSITVELKKLLMICPRKRRRISAYRKLVQEFANRGITLKIISRKTK